MAEHINHIKNVVVNQSATDEFQFFKVYEISVEKKRTLRSCVARKIHGKCLQNTRTVVRPANGRHTEIIPWTTKKEPADNIADYVLKYTLRLRSGPAKMEQKCGWSELALCSL